MSPMLMKRVILAFLACRFVSAAEVKADEYSYHNEISIRFKDPSAISARETTFSSENIPTYELQALNDLFNSTHGADWIWNATLGVPWVFTDTANPCEEMWQGVMCTVNASVLHVLSLTLPAMNLLGTVPDSIGVLSELQQLYLPSNTLYGAIPGAVGNLTKLTDINLSDNSLNSTLPASIGNLYNLSTLALHNNDLHGQLPDSFGAMRLLQSLTIYNNGFGGELPESLSNCAMLKKISAGNNFLNGTLPVSYSALTELSHLSLYSNFLHGTLPASFLNLSALQYLDLSNNHLSGTIPDVFRNMTQFELCYLNLNAFTGPFFESLRLPLSIISFDASQNLLNGTVSPAFGSLPDLQLLYGYENMLSGTLPPELGDCPYMLYFIFGNNHLTGVLPESFGNWAYLEYLELNNNSLSGPIPGAFGGLDNMYYFQLNYNHLTGTVPAELGTMIHTVYLVINANLLSGPFPDAIISRMPNLYALDLGNNAFTGMLPDSVGTLSYFQYLNVYNNFFSGTLPESYGALTYLQYFFFDNNTLTGTIPNGYGGMARLQEFYGELNLLSGTLPESLGGIQYMQFLSLANTIITGTIPASYANMAYLLALILASNHLTGTIENVFNATLQTELVTIVLNDNQLSGTLPEELFRLPKLNSFGAVSNCFHGRLPSTVCSATSLVTLALDGLSSAASCRVTLLPGISTSYVVHRSLHGTVPSCLFALPTLITLHLSGNGFSGSLSDAPITPFLLDLSLSHNVLTGIIPEHIQARKWYNLDLSYNRLSGSLLENFASETRNATLLARLSDLIGINVTQEGKRSTLSLVTNRLSGNLPQTIESRQNVSILGSNVFSCNIQESNLPQHDDGRKNYQCGSDSFNVPFYLWLSLVSVVAVAALLVWRYQAVVERYVGLGYALRHLHKWATVLESNRDVVSDDRVKSYRSVMELSAMLCKIAARCTAYIVLVQLPLYTGLSSSYGTLLHQYAWVASAAYLTGWLPATLMLVCLLGLLAIVLVGFAKYLTKLPALNPAQHPIVQTKPDAHKPDAHKPDAHKPDAHKPDAHKNSPVRSTALVVLIYVLFLVMNLIVVVGANTAYVIIAIYGQSDLLLLSQLALSCFKLFWNRFFSVYLIRWTAQLEALMRPTPTADASMALRSAEGEFVTLQMAVALLNNIAIPCLVVAGISPSCFYNVFVVAPKVTSAYTYQACGVVYGSSCLFFEPVDIETSYNPPFAYSYQCSSSFITYYAPTFVLLCLMRAFASPVAQFAMQQLHRRAEPNTRWFALLDSVLLPNLKPIVPGEPAQVNVFKPFFDANQLLLSLFTYLGLLLTFGAVFPPVALALLVTLLAVLYFNKLKVSRFLCQALEQKQLDYVDAVEAESGRSGFLPVLERAVWLLVTVSCWFYTLFLFDTLGDAVGFAGAYWVLIVMPLMPVVLYVLWRGWWSVHKPQMPDTAGMEERGTEMRDLGDTTVNILLADR